MAMADGLVERALAAVSEQRLVDLLCRMVDVPSPTGAERVPSGTMSSSFLLR